MPISKPAYYLIITISFLIALSSFRFLFLDMKLVFPDFGDHIDQRKLYFIAHITAAPTALILGLINLLERKRAKRPNMHRWPNLHRWSGRFYGVSILIAGLSGLALAIDAAGGTIPAFGFGILSVLWIATTGIAIRHAMAKNFRAHRQWMIRSFSLTFAAVTLRIYLLGFVVIGGYSYADASVWIAWLCWVPNLIFAEWWIRRKQTPHLV